MSIIHVHDRRKPMKIYKARDHHQRGPTATSKKSLCINNEAITQGDEKRKEKSKKAIHEKTIGEKYKTFIPQSQ